MNSHDILKGSTVLATLGTENFTLGMSEDLIKELHSLINKAIDTKDNNFESLMANLPEEKMHFITLISSFIRRSANNNIITHSQKNQMLKFLEKEINKAYDGR